MSSSPGTAPLPECSPQWHLWKQGLQLLWRTQQLSAADRVGGMWSWLGCCSCSMDWCTSAQAQAGPGADAALQVGAAVTAAQHRCPHRVAPRLYALLNYFVPAGKCLPLLDACQHMLQSLRQLRQVPVPLNLRPSCHEGNGWRWPRWLNEPGTHKAGHALAAQPRTAGPLNWLRKVPDLQQGMPNPFLIQRLAIA